MEELIKFILDSSIIDAGVKNATQKSITLGAALAPTFFIINTAWNFATSTINNAGRKPGLFNKADLIRAGLLMFILTAGYQPLFGSIARLGESLGRYSIDTSPKVTEGKEKTAALVAKEMEKDKQAASQEASPQTNNATEENPSMWTLVKGGINLWIFTLFSGGTLFLTTIIRTVVVSLAIMLSKILFTIGPVVIAFTILPIFKDKLSQWFGIYVCCLCVPFTCNLLDTIYFSIIAEGLKGETIVNPLTLSVFNIAYVITYCLVFWITSLYAGSSTAGKFLSTAVTAATTLLGNVGTGMGAAPSTPAPQGGNIIEDTARATQNAQ